MSFVTKNAHNANDILDRVKNLLSIKTDLALSEALGVKANTISTWRTRDSIDYDTLLNLCFEKEFDLNFVIYGIFPIKDTLSKALAYQQELKKIEETIKLVKSDNEKMIEELKDKFK